MITFNGFKDKIIANLGTKVNSWKTQTGTTMAAPIPTGRKKRRNTAIVGSLVQLAGFMLSVFNQHKLTSIRESLEGSQEESKYVASKVSEAFLRLGQLIDSMEKAYQADQCGRRQ